MENGNENPELARKYNLLIRKIYIFLRVLISVNSILYALQDHTCWD